MRKKEIVRVAIIAAAVPALALLYFFVDARHSDFFPACPFFTITGLYCPGCGSQRAVSSLLHADFAGAAGYNVMLIASVPLIAYSAFVTVADVFGTKPAIQQIFYSPLFARVFLVAVVLFGILRNLPFYPFTMLAP